MFGRAGGIMEGSFVKRDFVIKVKHNTFRIRKPLEF